MRRFAPVILLLAACSTEPGPTIRSVAPGEIVSAMGGNLIVEGTGLTAAAEAALLLGSRRVALTPVSGSDTLLELQVPVGMVAGLYDLEIAAQPEALTVERAVKVVEGELVIEVVNVGQGDGAYIQTPGGRTLVIDGGRGRGSQDSVVPTLESRGLTRPEFILSTHFDSDHLGGVVQLLNGPDKTPCTEDDRLPTLGLFDYAPRENSCNSDLCKDYYQHRRCNGSRIGAGAGVRVPSPGELLPLGGGVRATVVALNGEVAGGVVVPTGSDNSNSIALLLEFGRFRYFTAGDLTGGLGNGCNSTMDDADVETPTSQKIGAVDLLHVNHHGSCTSSNAAFLAALQPQVALISVGENNSYGHPHQEVVDRLGTLGAKLFMTTPGITQSNGAFPKTRLPATAEQLFGSLRIRSQDGRTFTVEVLDDSGRALVGREFTSRE